MTSEQYGEELRCLYGIAFWLASAPLEEMLQLQERTQTVGPLLDPTAWIKGRDAVQDDTEVTRTLLEAKRKLHERLPKLIDERSPRELVILAATLTQHLMAATVLRDDGKRGTDVDPSLDLQSRSRV